MRKVVISGTGVISAAGSSNAELSRGLEAGVPFACDITAFETAEGETTRACEISEFDLSTYAPSVKSYIDRTSALALAGATLALSESSLLEESSRSGEIGFSYGTQWGCAESMELFYSKLKSGSPRFAPPLPFSHSYANSPASVASIELKLRGYHMVVSSGRTSGAQALQSAMDAVALGRASCVLCAASDSLSLPVFKLYSKLGILRDDRAEPGEHDFLIGEGSGALVLEAEDAARARTARVLAELRGVCSCSSADLAKATEDAVRQALFMGGVGVRDVARVVSTGPSVSARRSEESGIASALETDAVGTGVVMRHLGVVLGETMSAGALLGVAAAIPELASGPCLVTCCDEATRGATATAVLIAPPR